METEPGTGLEAYAEAAQASLTDLRPEQMEASLAGDEEEDLAKVETADGIFEDGPDKEEDEEDEEGGEDGGPLRPHGEDDLRYTGESMYVPVPMFSVLMAF